VTRDEILEALCAMPEGAFDDWLLKLALPKHVLPSASAPQATRAADVVRVLEAQHRPGRAARARCGLRGSQGTWTESDQLK
jgi:hypothetical protein